MKIRNRISPCFPHLNGVLREQILLPFFLRKCPNHQIDCYWPFLYCKNKMLIKSRENELKFENTLL